MGYLTKMQQLPAACMFSLLCMMVTTWLTVHAYTVNKNPASGQLSPSVLLMGEFDWKLHTGSDGKPWSRCLDMVWRSRKYSNGDRLNFVPTHHWLPNSDGLGVASYCYMQSSGEGDKGSCQAWTKEKLAEFKESMTYCFLEAFNQGFVPYVRPHLDDGLHRGIWRNSLLFSPTTKYSGYTYADVMLKPLSEAMRDALSSAAKHGQLYVPPSANRAVVYMGLQGEMSATLMRFASDWASLVPFIKGIIGMDLADVKVGVGLNFNALDAVEGANTAGTGLLGMLLGGSVSSTSNNANAPSIQAANVKALFSNGIDFLGISAYAPYSGSQFGLNEFQNAAFNVGDALASLAGGMNLAELIKAGKIELHYSEFGIGGGVNGLAQLAPSADACAKQPWAGITGPYTSSLDPWRQNFLSSFRDEFYSKALDWLSSPAGATYNVQQVFVWCMASWDVFGIYPESSSDASTYRDLDIVQKIAGHNTAILAAQVCSFRGEKLCQGFITNNTACLSDVSGKSCLIRNTPPSVSVVTESGVSQDISDQPGNSDLDGEPGSTMHPTTGDSTMSTGSSGAVGNLESAPLVSGSLEMSPGDTAASPLPVTGAANLFTNATGPTTIAATVSPAQDKSPAKSSAGTEVYVKLISVMQALALAVVLLHV